MLTIRAQFYYLRLFLDIENVSSRPLARVQGGGGGEGNIDKKLEKVGNIA